MATKRMDRERFEAEVLECVVAVFRGERAAERLRQILPYSVRELPEALRRPPCICGRCGQPFESIVDADDCWPCRETIKKEAQEAELRKRAEEMAKAIIQETRQ